MSLLLTLGALAAGCGAGAFRAPVRNPSAVLSASDRAERLALGAIDPDLATDPEHEVQRMRRIAALELRAGNYGIAIEATLRALQIARAYAVLAPSEERSRAQSLHREMRDEAIATADRVGSLELALEAVGRVDPGGARDVIARLVRARADAGGSLAGLELAGPLARSLGEAARLDFERLGAEVPGEPLALDRLTQLGARALPRLHQLLRVAGRREDTARLAQVARAIRTIDRWDPIARAIGHLEDAQRLDLAPNVVASVVPAARGLSIARLSRARRDDPDSAALAIALAAYCREAHLEGDALEQAREAAALAQDDEQRRTAGLIAALAQGVDGGGGAIAEWEDANDRERRSIGIARAIAPLRSIAGASEALRARAQAAVRLLAREGVADPSLAFEVVIDRSIAEDERARALDALWVADRASARIAAECASQSIGREACEARLELLGDTTWWDGRLPTGAVPDLEETSLPLFELEVEDGDVAAAAHWAGSAASSRLAITPPWIRARIVLAGRGGDVSGARALLAEGGALLTAASRVALATWLDDLDAGRSVTIEDLSAALALGPAVTRFATPPIDAPHLEVAEVEANTERLVAADHHLSYDAFRADALRRLRPLLDGASGPEGAVIAGWMGTAVDRDARERGTAADALTSLAERAQALAPDTAVARLLEALRLQREGDHALARDALARSLVLAPSARMLQMRWLAAWSESDAYAPADDARSQLLAIDPIGLPRTVATGEATGVGDLLNLYGVYLPERHAELVVRGGPRMARAEGAWEAIESVLARWVARGPDASDAPSADTMLALVEAAAPSPARRRWLVRLRILLRDVDGAITAADAPERDEADATIDPPLAPDDRLRSIALARGELLDPLAWGLVAADALGDDPDTLERLRARARSRPELDALLCGELGRAQGHTLVTMETCVRSWRREPNPIAATVLARSFVEAPSTAWAHDLDADAFFAEVRSALGARAPGAALHQEALVLESRGEHARAVDAEIEAQARGGAPEAWGAEGPRLRHGLLVRAQRARAVAHRWAELALLALGDARLTAAQLYADAAIASMRRDGEPDPRNELVYVARDVVAWASSDLTAGRIDEEGVAAFERARVSGFADEETTPLVAQHPESSLVAYAAAVRAIRAGDHDEALRWADVALRESPRPTLVSVIAPIVEDERGAEQGEALRAQARTRFPDDPRIDHPATVVVAAAPSAGPRERVATASSSGEGCSLTRELAAAPSDAARGELLRDAFRAATDDAARDRVLACAWPSTAVATSTTPPVTPDGGPETVARAEEPTTPRAARPTLAERRRLAQEEELARAAEAQRLADEASRRALEGERRATEADARRAEAEARLAEAERRVAEAERRAIETRPRVAEAEPTAVAASEAELRAADAERRVADAERRASEAEARAALAERTAIEEARRIAAAAPPVVATTTETTITPPPRDVAPIAEAAPVVTEPAAPETTTLAHTEAPPVAADGGVPVAEPLVATSTTAPTPPTTPQAAPVPAPTSETATARTETAAPAPEASASIETPVAPTDAGAPPSSPAPPETPEPPMIRMLAQLPPRAPEAIAQVEALTAEADQRVAMSEARLAEATARATEAEALAAESGHRSSHAEVVAVESERRVVEAETRAAEAELRAAEASHRLEAVVRAPEPTPTVVATEPTSSSTSSPSPVAPPDAPPAHFGGLGVAAVLDADPEAHRRGVALAVLDPEGALATAREIVHAPARAAVLEADALPPFGTVQALVALPPSARRTLASELMNGSDRSLRLLALAAERVLPGTVDVDTLRRTIEGDDAGLAIEAVRAHGLRPEPVELEAMRARLDAMRPPLAGPERELARAIVHALAGAVDARDRARLAGAEALVRGGLADDAQADGALTARAVAHDAALYLAARARGAPRDPSLAPEVERIRRAHQTNLPSAAAVRLLATEPLTRVLTGTSWRYARLAHPSQFVSSMTSADVDPAIAGAASAWLAAHGGSELGTDGGLDLDRPMECALADSGPDAWVCIAHVRDRDHVRAALARRPLGGHSAAWLARGLPVLAGATPLSIDRILEGDATSASGSVSFAERARAEVDLGGVVVERYATLVRRDDRTTEVDAELYLFTGDRVVVFGDEEMARTIVGRPPTPGRSLGRSARFRRVTRDFSDGPFLEIAALDWRGEGELPLVVRRDSSIAVSVDAGGIAVTTRAPFAEPRRDVAPLASLLPDDAIARFALGSNAPRPVRARGRPLAIRALRDRAAVGRLVLREAERVAFAWMPAEGTLWDRWVAIGEGPRLDAALASAGVARPEEGAVVEVAGTFVARRGTRWLIAPLEDDVRAALARPDVAADRAAVAIGSGRLDGPRGSRAVLALVQGLPVGDPRRAALDALGAQVAATGELSFEARVEARQLVSVTRVRPASP